MSDLSANIIFSPCMHRHVVVDASGGRHFTAGEVWDDIQVRVLCLDCLEYLSEDEVRAAWGQESEVGFTGLQLEEEESDGPE